MEPEQAPEVQEVTVESKQSAWNTVTPLSKYLAMTLFVLLPFVGGYIGYTFAPEKIVEIEKEVVREVIVEKEVESGGSGQQGYFSEPSFEPTYNLFELEELETFTDEVVGFTFQYPKVWGPIEIERPSSTRTYLFRGEGMSAGIFLATDFASHAAKPREYGPYWGDFVGFITSENIENCPESFGIRDTQRCNEYTNSQGTVFNEYIADAVAIGDDLPHKGDYEYFFATVKPGTAPGDDFHAILLSTDRLINRPWADNVFRNTVIETFRFIE